MCSPVNHALDNLVRLWELGLPKPTPVAIRERPASHDVANWLRAHGWTYHPTDRCPWHHGRVAVHTADEALSLELGESRMEWR